MLVALAGGMHTWQAGDRVDLVVPQLGISYTTTILRVESLIGGARSYVGRLIEGDRLSTFVVTVGANGTFAYLGTPEGSYELVGNRELAWLMPTANMDRHVDYSKPDYFVGGEDRDVVIGHQLDPSTARNARP